MIDKIESEAIMKSTIKRLVEGENLKEQEMMDAMECIMEGFATDAQIGSFITALRIKGETIDEITGCAKVMRKKAANIRPEVGYLIDTCGTGGDCSNTFNISTASAIVAAAAGAFVAKHGNRSVSSRSGSADVLEALGVNISLKPHQVSRCIEATGIGFMFAPLFHSSMKYAAGPRKELGIRSIFNMLGPLTNPANARGHVLGVFDEELAAQFAETLLRLGVERALVVHGKDGLDEISVSAPTTISELKDGSIENYEINPSQFGFKPCVKSELLGGDMTDNARIIMSVLQGEKGAKRDAVVVNASAAMYVGGAADSLEQGIEKARYALDSGLAINKLEEFKAFTNSQGDDAL
jgi:anthranilate phosphoribosyltransferase